MKCKFKYTYSQFWCGCLYFTWIIYYGATKRQGTNDFKAGRKAFAQLKDLNKNQTYEVFKTS
jgi:hypothetical protein